MLARSSGFILPVVLRLQPLDFAFLVRYNEYNSYNISAFLQFGAVKQVMGVAVCGSRAALRVSNGILSPELITAESYDLTLSSRRQGCV